MRMKLGVVAALLAGLGLMAYVLWWIGLTPVVAAIGRAGIGGFVVIVLAAVPMLGFLGLAWRSLTGPLAPHWVYFVSRQLRDSATDLLPFTQIGGVVIGARAGILGGIPATTAYSSTVVDFTAEMMAQVAFTILGLLIGLGHLRAVPELAGYADALIVGTVLLIPASAAFIVLQRKGSKLAASLAASFLPAAVAHTEEFSANIERLYRQPIKLAIASSWHLLAWLAAGAWLWVIFRACGAHIGMLDCIAIESLLAALRGVMLFVPASLGVQEAGYAALAAAFGVGPEIGLAVSLLKRGRDVVIGIPVLLIWQAIEGRRVLRAKPAAGGARRMIVTADDFGADPAVNEGVIRGHREGILTCASLMVAAPAADEAVRLAKQTPSLKVGLHLVLVEGRPCLPPSAIPDLVAADGHFRTDMVRFGIDIFFRPKVRRQLAAEIEAQFAAFAATGLSLDHVNAHKHFHLHPTIAALIVGIGARYGLAAVRVPFEPTSVLRRIEPGTAGNPLVAWWAKRLRARLRRAGLFCPDQTFGLAWSGAMHEDRLCALLETLPNGVSEIYFHPALADAYDGSAPGYAYRQEAAALVSPRAKALAAALPSGGFGGFPDEA